MCQFTLDTKAYPTRKCIEKESSAVNGSQCFIQWAQYTVYCVCQSVFQSAGTIYCILRPPVTVDVQCVCYQTEEQRSVPQVNGITSLNSTRRLYHKLRHCWKIFL